MSRAAAGGAPVLPLGGAGRFKRPRGVYLQPAERGRSLLREGDTLSVWPKVR